MVSTSQHTNSLHKILASKLTLTIPPSKSSSSSPPTEDFDFSDVFGPSQSPSCSQSPYLGDPQVIHNRSHSFLGPSPRYSIPTSHPFHQTPEEIISNITDDDDEIEVKFEDENKDGTFVEHLVCIEEEREDEIVSKVGPEDFEILRVIGKGAFGKVFQVRKKGEDCEIGDDYDEEESC
ncbi:hypothetical protein BVRB_5g115900 isoform B [Beta vulgaris subsp. vulgaris]|nr:hypothetical protein BVRB_5g115900 isoform B [Beta vulgaris subsp. vulgaris]